MITIYITLLKTLRYFPICECSKNCYNIRNVPKGHYFVNEPLFDVSIEVTQIRFLQAGWSGEDDQAFA
jgi:hypothetical protein